MTRRIQRTLLIGLPIAFLSTLAFAQDKEPPKPSEKKDIVDSARLEKNLSIFSDLVRVAELDELLRSAGPHTVFAPTDEAFKKLGQETLDSWKKPENKAKLQNILKYHIAAGRHLAAQMAKMKTVATVQGQEAKIAAKDGKIKIDDATITRTDIDCSNGVIHIIDTVMMPKDTH